MAESLNSTGSRLRMAFGWYCVSAALQFGSLNESLVVLHHAKGHSKAQPRSHASCACACARACACAMCMCVCRTNDGVRIVMHTPGDDLFSRRRGVALLQGGVRPRNDLAILLAHTPGRACTGVELHVRHGRTATGTLSRETNFRNSGGNLLSGALLRLSPSWVRSRCGWGRGARSTLVVYMPETELHKAARDGESPHHHFQKHEPFFNHALKFRVRLCHSHPGDKNEVESLLQDGLDVNERGAQGQCMRMSNTRRTENELCALAH